MPKEPAWLGNEGQKGPSEDSKTSQDNWCQEMISKLALWLTKKINTRNSQWKWPITLINSQSVWVAFPVLIEVWWLSALVAKNQLWKKKKTKRRYWETRPRAQGSSHLHAAPRPALWNTRCLWSTSWPPFQMAVLGVPLKGFAGCLLFVWSAVDLIFAWNDFLTDLFPKMTVFH